MEICGRKPRNARVPVRLIDGLSSASYLTGLVFKTSSHPIETPRPSNASTPTRRSAFNTR